MVDTGKHIDRAEKEVARKNFDLAISLYDQLLALDPDNGEARTGKRRAEIKKYSKSYPGALTRGLKNIGWSFAIPVASICRAHAAAANMSEKALNNDPCNIKLNLALGHALLKSGHKNGAESAFAIVTEFDPNDVESLKTLGQLYYDGRKWDEALACFEKVLKISPRDQDAVKMRKNLAAEGAIKTGGYEGAGSARDLAKSQEQMSQLEQRQKLIRSEGDLDQAVEELRAELEGGDESAEKHVRLGGLLQQKRDLSGAVRAFQRAQELEPDDGENANRLGDARITELDDRIRSAKAEKEAGEEGADDMLRRLLKERKVLRVDEFGRRVSSHPTDSGLRFKFGRYLLDDGQIDEAIAELQVSVKDPRHKVNSMTLLGQAFLRKGLPDLAIRQLEQALESSGGVGEKTLPIVHALATAHEQQGNLEGAMREFTKIFEIDISFRDVSSKLDELRSKLN